MNAVRFTKNLQRAMASIALALAALLPAMSLAAQWDIDQLMQSLAKNKAGRATFVEKKTVAVLERPIESSGELSYIAPDKLEKKTVKPKPETLLLDGDVLTIERGRKTHVLRLQQYPEVAVFIDSIRGTLAGDRKALERSYALKLDGNVQHWTLTLLPHDERIAQAVQKIQITGSRDDVKTIDILQVGGDRSSMVIERVSAQ